MEVLEFETRWQEIGTCKKLVQLYSHRLILHTRAKYRAE